MGFIFAGRAYKQPQYMKPAQTPINSQRQQNYSQPKALQNAPQVSNYAMRQPASSIAKRSATENHPKVVKKARKDHENSQSSVNNTQVQPKVMANAVAVPTTKPLIESSSRPSSLLDLPPEILYQIYCFAGVGKVNQLAQTCTELHTLFDFSQNNYFLTLLIQSNMLIDISKGVAARNWPRRFSKKYESLPERFRDSPVMEYAYHQPINAVRTLRVVDCSIFTYPGIDNRHVQLVKSRFGGIITDFTSAMRQRKRKRRYLEWRYMVFKKFVVLALQDPEAPPKLLMDEAEALVPCEEYRKLHKLDNFEPLLASLAVPLQMYHKVDLRKIRVIFELQKQYNMSVSRPAVLINSVFSTSSELPESLFDLLNNLNFDNSATETDVLDTLRAFDKFRFKLLDVPEELRETSELLHAVLWYFEFLRTVLTFYFQAPSQSQNDSGMIWEALKEIQIPDLLEHVVGLGVAVPLDIF